MTTPWPTCSSSLSRASAGSASGMQTAGPAAPMRPCSKPPTLWRATATSAFRSPSRRQTSKPTTPSTPLWKPSPASSTGMDTPSRLCRWTMLAPTPQSQPCVRRISAPRMQTSRVLSSASTKSTLPFLRPSSPSPGSRTPHPAAGLPFWRPCRRGLEEPFLQTCFLGFTRRSTPSGRTQ